MYKVEIFPKKETFFDDLLIFLSEKSSQFRRDFSIHNILNDSLSLDKKREYFTINNKIKLEKVYGSTFQSYLRGNDNIYAISHTITFLEFDTDKIYGILEPSDYGDVIDFSKGILQPVYYRPDKNSNWKIATFDIDFNISNIAA
jgi:hypothetical protein